MSTVAIVMSTYNGHEYIIEQIESILAQDYTDFNLFVRDDGSSDNTLEILQKLATRDSRIKLVFDKVGQTNSNKGFGESFSIAIGQAMAQGDFSYFAFCDQDDYWEPTKLSHAVAAMENSDMKRPTLYASNYYICDSNLQVQGTFADSTPLKNVTFENLFFEGVFPGFTIVINKVLARKAFSHLDMGDIYYHDKWVTLIAMGLNGKLMYDVTPLAKYRRHEGAASSTNLGPVKKLKWRIDKVLNGDFCPRTKAMLVTFKELFYKQVSYDIRDFLDTFTKRGRLARLFYRKRLRRSFGGEILLRIIILLGKL
ncbi:MAG: glycosyltransferase [Pseudobutyrivibrio sp.]|nr:glycosyltransferase [Pseudobutyrivibrio sp.]